MGTYYQQHLVGPDLRRAYELASPRIRRYLRAEIEYAVRGARGAGRVLELGCGYGRFLREIAPHVGRATGIDVVRANLLTGRDYLGDLDNCELVQTNAVRLAFADASFDVTLCVQNGLSAFRVDPGALVAEAVRVTKVRGRIFFSVYSPRIWDERLEWFRAQARAGLIGPVDEARTRPGTIVCEDGLRLTTTSGEELRELFARTGQRAQVREIDRSSVFAEVTKEAAGLGS